MAVTSALPRTIVIATVLGAALAVAWFARPVHLEFRDLAALPGFRELVLTGSTSRIDPIAGSFDHPAGTERDMEESSADLCQALSGDPLAPSVGSPDSPVTIVEFFDYRCPYCKTLATMLPGLQADTGVRVVYREWPILGESSELAARAALAADRQGRYLEFHSRLMASGFIPTPAYIDDVAARLGLDGTQLRADMASDDVDTALGRTRALAARLGLAGTPALVVGRTIVQGAVTRRQLERLVEIERSLPAQGGC